MQLNFRTGLVVIGLLVSLSACLDHRLGGTLSPTRLRLTTVQSGSAITTYSYDDQNRLTRITGPNGAVSDISYGDPQKKYVDTDAEAKNIFFVQYSSPSDPTTGLITLYPGNADGTWFDGTSFLAIAYPLINSKLTYGTHIRDYQYIFDASKHLSGYNEYQENGGRDYNSYAYQYSGENITMEKFSLSAGHGGIGTNTYTYDDKINPFFGLFDPNIDIVQRFSRNNPVSRVSSITGTSTSVTTLYSYEYNQQGLPIKRTKTGGGVPDEVITYSYESY